jgi:hypothetical protein
MRWVASVVVANTSETSLLQAFANACVPSNSLQMHSPSLTRDRSPSHHEQRDMAFAKGDVVSVNLSALEGLAHYNGCHLNGKIVDANTDPKKMKVLLVNKTTVFVEPFRLGPVRGADEDADWKVGDLVEVYEVNDGEEGWWEAEIKRKKKKKNAWEVTFRLPYEGKKQIKSVKADELRSAGPSHFANWNKVSRYNETICVTKC